MSFPHVSRNGILIPTSDAVMPISNIEYAYGFGVYENLRVVRGKAAFLEDHLRRLLCSAEILKIDHSFTTDRIRAWVQELLSTIDGAACNLKMLLIGGRTGEDATLFIVPLAPLFPDKRLYVRGATAVTYSYERLFPKAKSLNMLGSYLAYREAKQAGAYDALLVNRSGCITEGTRTNVFGMRGRTIVSPPEEEILDGVTMMHVLRAAKDSNFTVKYEPIPLKLLAEFDSMFLSSTSSKIMPLSRVDDHVFKISDPLKELMRAFDVLAQREYGD